MFSHIRQFIFGKRPKAEGSLICDHCGHNEFYTGPSGGSAEMIECSNCGKGYTWNGITAEPNGEDSYIYGMIFDRKLEKR
jgi:hypothetical protein